jgi:hypothetical protein
VTFRTGFGTAQQTEQKSNYNSNYSNNKYQNNNNNSYNNYKTPKDSKDWSYRYQRNGVLRAEILQEDEELYREHVDAMSKKKGNSFLN